MNKLLLNRILGIAFFGLLASSPSQINAQTTAGDCSSAVNICTNGSFSIDPNGFGTVDELAGNSISNPSVNPNGTNAGCLLSGELNSTWMVVNIATTGQLEFSLGDPSLSGNCLDWIMWQYDANTCAGIIGNTLPPVQCNWNGACGGITGAASPADIIAIGGDPTDFEAPLNVTCGEQYLICLSNYSSATTNVALNFFGSAQVSCNTFTPIVVNDETICDGLCATLTANGGNSYTWNANPDLSATNTATVTACPTGGPGTYDYIVTGTGSCGTGTDTATVTVLPSTDPLCSTPCNFTFMDVNLTACAPATGTFDITGQVQFTGAPTTGQLIIQNCSGDQVVFNAPFASPINYSILGITADGTANCTVTATFTSDPTCTITSPQFTEPTCPCNINNFQVNIGACQTATDTYDVDGTIDFQSPPGTGTLVVEIACGPNVYDTIINLPFVSPQTFSISGIPSDGLGCNITTYFTSDPACTSTIPFTAPASCSCPADAGTYNVTTTGNGNTNYVLCFGDQIDFTHNNDFTPPQDLNDPNTPYNPGIWWVIYSCPPTPGIDILADPCFEGVISTTQSWFDINDLSVINSFPAGTFTNNTVYYAPLTMYDVVSGTYSLYPPPNLCFDLGAPTAVTYLTDIQFSAVEDCPNGTVTVTLTGGHPEIFGTNYTASNLLPGSAAFANTTATHGGTIVITGLQDGDMYSFDVIDQNGCPITVTGGPFVGPPDATINPAGPFCLGDPALNLTAATPGGNWTGTGITNGANGTFDPATAGVGTHTITYTVGGACPSTDTEDIVVNSSFDATITPAGPFCEDAASVILAAVDPGGTWTGTGIINGATGEFDPATAGPGNHIITYTIAGSCGATDTETITVNALDDATITPAGPFCDSDPAVNLTAATGGGTWSGTGITNAALGTFDPAVSGVGTFAIDYVTAGACPSSDQINITVTSQLDATITPAGPFCESNPAATLAAADPGGTWSGTGITDAINGIFDPATAGPGIHTITYTLGGACGNVDTEDITVIADDDATINPAGPFCTTDPIFTMTAADPNGTWSIITPGAPAGSINAANGNLDPSVLGAGTWTVQYTIPGACGDTDTEDVIVTNQLDATITPAGPFCESDPVFMLSAVDPGGAWSATCGACVNGATGEFNPAIAGPGLHTITYTLGGNCGDVQTEDITVLPDADATVTPAGPFCIGNPSVFMTAVDPGGTWSGNGIINPATGEFDPTVAGPGSHVITYTIVGQCGDVGTTTININDPLGVTAFTDMTICVGDNANLSALATGGDGNYTYTWTDGAGNQVGVGQFITVTPAVTTTYTVTLTDGCGSTSVSDQVTITVNPLPVIDFVVDNANGCAPLTVTFTDNTVPAGTSCLWDFGDTFSSTDCGVVSHTYTEPGCYDVTLTITSNGCQSTSTQTNMVCVEENAIADFSFTPDSTTVFDPEFSFTNLSSNADSYLWTFGDNTSSTLTDPTHVYPATPSEPMVCLIAYTNAGCNDTICKPVIINDEFTLYVPNAFTPGSDAFNNDFGPHIFGHVPESYEFLIFDRWGLIIFESYHLSDRWDGRDNSGVMAKTDVYVWKLKVKSAITGEKKEYIGHVTLLK